MPNTPEILYDETSYAQLLNSPLELKNAGVDGFSILIKSAILTAYAMDIKKNVSLIEGTRNSLDRFYDFYVEKLHNLKQKYLRAVGTGSYDLLSSADVEEIFSAFGKQEEGVPIAFDMEQYEDIMTRLNHLMNDTDEIAYHMDKMGKDFDKKDQELAQWLGLK
ncbi:hypothetical protein P5G51_000405 [Virgibacillus sp. 179-BFC.A HS]|uniref:Uncharacterized protein n=1 Tax=Tigheibacillus jepli TaxID=3035914 RepID=A0ABU5CCZ2_9BACI|nr:hypothetical protein [Virgibacillus sp. 179-BFC.A HS]MDY0404075.1 hypothetical protein [Virgibacillus sp. 179-BFC.A HS]